MTRPDGHPGDATAWRQSTLGVDLGTSHTVAMLRWPDGRTRPLLFDGRPLLPSAVYLDTTGRLHVGRDALRLGQAEPARIEPHPKRHIDADTVLLGGAEVPVADLLAALLGAVAREAVAAAGFLPPAVLTHPAAWGARRRAVLTEALARAGWPAATRLVPEPVAAARYFADVLRRPVPVGAALAVFDFGGGTLDVAVVRNEGFDADGQPRFAVAACGGADDLGGLDVDAALVDHLGRGLAGDEPAAWAALTDPATLAQWRARRQFWEDVRGAKEMLSRAALAPVPVPGVEHAAQVTRDELEAAAGPLIRRGVTEAATVIRAAALSPSELAGLFLVGGSSRVPLVARWLHGELGVAPTVLEQPELPVAEGAIVVVAGEVGRGPGGSPAAGGSVSPEWAAASGDGAVGPAAGSVSPAGVSAASAAGSAAGASAAVAAGLSTGDLPETAAHVPVGPASDGEARTSGTGGGDGSTVEARGSADHAGGDVPIAAASSAEAQRDKADAGEAWATDGPVGDGPGPAAASSAAAAEVRYRPGVAEAATPTPTPATVLNHRQAPGAPTGQPPTADREPQRLSAAASPEGPAVSAGSSRPSAPGPSSPPPSPRPPASPPPQPSGMGHPAADAAPPSGVGHPAADAAPPSGVGHPAGAAPVLGPGHPAAHAAGGPEPEYAEPVDPWATGEAAAFAQSGGAPLFPGSGAPAGHGAESWLASTHPEHDRPGATAVPGADVPVPAYRKKWFWLVAAALVLVVGVGATLTVVFWPGYRSLDYRSLAASPAVVVTPEVPVTSGFQASAVIGDRAYFASVSDDGVLGVVAADAESGKRLWGSRAAGTAPRWEQMVALPSAVVLFTDTDSATSKRRMVVLGAERGDRLWERTIGADDGVLFSGDVAVLVDRAETRLVGIRLADGKGRWEQDDPAAGTSTTTSVVSATTSADLNGPASVSGVAFAPDLDDDKRIVQVSADKSFRVLDAATGAIQVASRPGRAEPDDEKFAHDGRFVVVESDGTSESVLAYDLDNASEPDVLYSAPADVRITELTACGAERACWVETTAFDVKTTRVASVNTAEGGDVWHRAVPGTDSLVPVGDHVLAGRSASPPRVSLLDGRGKQVWDVEGQVARLDGGNLLRFNRALSTTPEDPTLYGEHLGDQAVPLGGLSNVRSRTCSWNTSVIACVSDETFLVQRFAG